MIPVIESIDENKPILGVKTVYRDSIMLVVKHPHEDKYLYLHNKKFDWNILLQGGIDENENMLISAIRELIEETGYNDIKSVTKLDFEMDNVYYAAHKNENRYALIKTFYIELNSLYQLEYEDDAEVLFETYENLYDLFGAPFRHHYYLLGIATGKEVFTVNDDSSKLGNVTLINQQVKYRKISDNPKEDIHHI